MRFYVVARKKIRNPEMLKGRIPSGDFPTSIREKGLRSKVLHHGPRISRHLNRSECTLSRMDIFIPNPNSLLVAMGKEQKGPGCGRARRRFRGGPWGRGCRGERKKGRVANEWGLWVSSPPAQVHAPDHSYNDRVGDVFCPSLTPSSWMWIVYECIKNMLGAATSSSTCQKSSHTTAIWRQHLAREQITFHTKLDFPCIRELLLSTATPSQTNLLPLSTTHPASAISSLCSPFSARAFLGDPRGGGLR